MTTITNNKLTDETLKAWKTEAIISLGETPKDCRDYSHHEAILALVTELQECRKADSAEPIHQNYPDDGWCDCSKEIYEKLTELGCRTRIVYAAPPVPEECPAELLAFCEQVIDSRITANAKADELWNACRTAMQQAAPVELQECRKADSAEPDYIRYDCGCCGWETIEDWRESDVCPKCNHKPMGKTELYTTPPASERERIRREHAEWSDKTFGDVGSVGPLKHLSKEALETAAAPDDLSEWADMQFLLWDAQRRMGLSDEFITRAMIEKLEINKSRQWPEPKDGEPRLHIKEQPVPVVPEEITRAPDVDVFDPGFMAGWNACRAAMLNGGKS